MDELYYLLDINGICLEDDRKERDKAIKILLQIKKKKAQTYNKKIIEDKDIINEYNKEGMDGIKKFFSRTICYLYSTNFVYSILFHHYKTDWRKVETIIKDKINEQKK
tara:strand:- start:253 stop:576 length:324 start_codon:yes stop_codon:yes gene_type:complete